MQLPLFEDIKRVNNDTSTDSAGSPTKRLKYNCIEAIPHRVKGNKITALVSKINQQAVLQEWFQGKEGRVCLLRSEHRVKFKLKKEKERQNFL